MADLRMITILNGFISTIRWVKPSHFLNSKTGNETKGERSSPESTTQRAHDGDGGRGAIQIHDKFNQAKPYNGGQHPEAVERQAIGFPAQTTG